MRGYADTAYFAETGYSMCTIATRCLRMTYAGEYWMPVYRFAPTSTAFHGSLLVDKADASGQLFRRNRYYDPATGRFTQEDPIGLAGGLNVYGFASGDPVNFGDPFGLWPWPTLNQTANFAAGFGDALTFGLTDMAREGLGWNDGVDRHSGSYVAGEVTEFAAEVALTAGSAALKKAAGEVAGKTARSAARPFVEAVEKQAGEVVHHINPLAGHPGGAGTTFPLRGLSSAVHSGGWNLKAMSKTAHAAAHTKLRQLDAIVGVLWDPNAVVLRGMMSAGRSTP